MSTPRIARPLSTPRTAARAVNISTQPLKKKKQSGIPAGNAGEYFVMGELLRRGFDAQLADRNTAGYDMLVGRAGDAALRKIQVKTVRKGNWFIKQSDYTDPALQDRITIFVEIGAEGATGPVRYFITRNRDLAASVRVPSTGKWPGNGYMPAAPVQPFEDHWATLETFVAPERRP